MKGLLSLTLLLLSGLLQAQDVQMSASAFQKELLGVQKQFSASNLEITYSRELLIEGEETVKESGTFLRGSGLDYSLSQNGALIVQNKTGKLIIDSVQRTVVLTIVDSLFSMMNTPDLTDENVAKVYILSKSVSGKVSTYRMTPRSEGIERAELIVPVSGGTPVTMRVVLPLGNYISHSIDDESLEEPVMTIVYTSVKNIKPSASAFSFEKHLSYSDGKYHLKGFPSDFIFHDLRPNTSK